MPEVRELMFHDLARYYDLLYGQKDYRSQAETLSRLASRYGRSKGRDWLDVACGTGRHLEFLQREHAVVGVDLSRDMLRIARRRLPGVRLVQGDMRTFRIGQRFDVVTCLFSAIGHLGSAADTRAAFANFGRHLKPGGVAIVEPWIDPKMFRGEMLHVLTARDEHTVVTRLAHSGRRGRYSLISYDYLIGRSGHATVHVRETNRGLMLGPRELVALMEAAGMRARLLRPGFLKDRGLLLGQKPMDTC